MSLTVEKILDNYCTNLNKIVLYLKGKQSDMKDLVQLRIPDHMLNPSSSEINLNIDLLRNVERIKGSEILADLRLNVSDAVFDSGKFKKSLMREALKSNLFRKDASELKDEVDHLKTLHMREPQPLEKFLDIVQSKMQPNQSTKRKMELSQFVDSRETGIEDSIEMLLIKRLAFLEKRMPRDLAKQFEKVKHTLGSIMIDYVGKISELDASVLSNKEQNENLKTRLEDYMMEIRTRKKGEAFAHDRYLHLAELLEKQKDLGKREIRNLQQKLEACRSLIGMEGDNFMADDYEIVIGDQYKLYKTNEIIEASEAEEDDQVSTPNKQSPTSNKFVDTPIKEDTEGGEDFGFDSYVDPHNPEQKNLNDSMKKKHGKGQELDKRDSNQDQEVKSNEAQGHGSDHTNAYMNSAGRKVIKVTPEELIHRVKNLEMDKNKWTQYIRRLEDKHKKMDNDLQSAKEELKRYQNKYKKMISSYNEVQERNNGAEETGITPSATEDNFAEQYSQLLAEFEDLKRYGGDNSSHLRSYINKQSKALNSAMSTIRGLEQQGHIKSAETRRLYEIVQALSTGPPPPSSQKRPAQTTGSRYQTSGQPQASYQPQQTVSTNPAGGEADSRMYERALMRCDELKEQIMHLKKKNAAIEDEIYRMKKRETKLEEGISRFSSKISPVEMVTIRGKKVTPDDITSQIESYEDIIKKRTEENDTIQRKLDKVESQLWRLKGERGEEDDDRNFVESQVLQLNEDEGAEGGLEAARERRVYGKPNEKTMQGRYQRNENGGRVMNIPGESREDRMAYSSQAISNRQFGNPQGAGRDNMDVIDFQSREEKKKLEELYSYSRHLLQRYAAKIDELKEQVMQLKIKNAALDDEVHKSKTKEKKTQEVLDQLGGKEREIEFILIKGNKTNSDDLLSHIESLERLVDRKNEEIEDLEREVLGAKKPLKSALKKPQIAISKVGDSSQQKIEEEGIKQAPIGEDGRDEVDELDPNNRKKREVEGGSLIEEEQEEIPLHNIDDETLESKLREDTEYMRYVRKAQEDYRNKEYLSSQQSAVRQVPVQDPKLIERISSLQEVVKNMTDSNSILENQNQDLSKKSKELSQRIVVIEEALSLSNEKMKGLKLQYSVEKERTAQQDLEIYRLKKEISGVRLVNSQLFGSGNQTQQLISPRMGKLSPTQGLRKENQNQGKSELVLTSAMSDDKFDKSRSALINSDSRNNLAYDFENENIDELLMKSGRENEDLREKNKKLEAQIQKLNQASALYQNNLKGLESKIAELNLEVSNKESQMKNLQQFNKAVSDRNFEINPLMQSPTSKKASRSIQVDMIVDDAPKIKQLTKNLEEKDYELTTALLQIEELTEELAAKDRALEEVRKTLLSVFAKKQYLINLILKLDDDIYVGGRPIKKLNEQSLDKLLDHAIETTRGTTQSRSSFSVPTRSSIQMITLKAPELSANRVNQNIIDHTKSTVPASANLKVQQQQLLDIGNENCELRTTIEKFVRKEEELKTGLVRIIENNIETHPEEKEAYLKMRDDIDVEETDQYGEKTVGMNYAHILRLIEFINLHPGMGKKETTKKPDSNLAAYSYQNPPDMYGEDNLLLEFLKRNEEYQNKLKELTSRKVLILTENLQNSSMTTDPSNTHTLKQLIDCLKPYSAETRGENEG